MNMFTVKDIKSKMHNDLGAKPSKADALAWWEKFFDRNAAMMYTRVYFAFEKYISTLK